MPSNVILRNTDDYFLPMEKRAQGQCLFCRFVGWDDNSLNFLNRFYEETKKLGLYFAKPFENPQDLDVKFFYQTVGTDFDFTAQGREVAVKKWFLELNRRQQAQVASVLETMLLTMEQAGIKGGVLKNSFIKFLCWMKYQCIGLLTRMPFVGIPKVLYEGEIGKYELILFEVLHLLGCDILLVNFTSDEAYMKADPNERCSKALTFSKRGEPPVHFTKMDWQKRIKEQAQKIEQEKQLEKAEGLLLTNNLTGDDIFAELDKTNAQRGGSSARIYNIFAEYRGAENPEEYASFLFRSRKSLEQDKRSYIIIEGKIPPPTTQEVSAVEKVRYQSREELLQGLARQLSFYEDELMNLLLKRAFLNLMGQEGEMSHGKLYNLGVCLVCFLRRYQSVLFGYKDGALPLFILYGNCSSRNEQLFLELISAIALDVLILCPDLSLSNSIAGDKILRIEHPHSIPVGKYPTNEERIVASTVARRAERELDTLLYTDSGMFRSRQFKDAIPVTLQTTCDEIDILWKQEAKYRPYFEAKESGVTIPTIFAKLSGVKDGDVPAYFNSIQNKVTEDTIVINKVPYIKSTDENPIKGHVVPFVKNNILQIDEIRKHSCYQYDYLSEEVQQLILNKIQALINEDLIDSRSARVEYTIVATLLNLDKQTVRLIQRFDFTKDVPKLILVDTRETMCSVEDAIYVVFLSLIGFDILVYSPAGYRVIDKYLKKDILREHILGEFVFDLEPPDFKREQKNPFMGGVMSRLFGTGRN